MQMDSFVFNSTQILSGYNLGPSFMACLYHAASPDNGRFVLLFIPEADSVKNSTCQSKSPILLVQQIYWQRNGIGLRQYRFMLRIGLI